MLSMLQNKDGTRTIEIILKNTVLANALQIEVIMVPQEAVLSPLLFSIYTNDTPSDAPNCNLMSFVDDSKLLILFPIEEALNALRK